MNLKLNQVRLFSARLIASAVERKFMSTFRAFRHFALYRRGTIRACKCPAICYVKVETTFRAFYNVLRLLIHSLSLSINQSVNEFLKTFLKILINKSIKYWNLLLRKVVCRGQFIWE